MPLPEFNEFGDLPEGRYADASLLFDHSRANDELGASVFWIRPDMLVGETLEEFFAFWQTTRDGRRRGIVEIQP